MTSTRCFLYRVVEHAHLSLFFYHIGRASFGGQGCANETASVALVSCEQVANFDFFFSSFLENCIAQIVYCEGDGIWIISMEDNLVSLVRLSRARARETSWIYWNWIDSY